jgi:hypothetical protein
MKSRSNRSFLSFSFFFATTSLLLSLLPTIALAKQTTHSCNSVDVFTFPERVHVRCSTAASGGIIFFAVPTANNENAARILSTLLAGHISGRTLVIGYDPTDTSGTAFGCAQNDCRRLLYVGVR